MSLIKNYPKIDGDREYYVRHPIMVTKENRDKMMNRPKPGTWVAVDVLESGFKYLLSPMPHKTEETCQSACDAENRICGFSKKEAVFIITVSMSFAYTPD
jgi:hypothetical protein